MGNRFPKRLLRSGSVLAATVTFVLLNGPTAYAGGATAGFCQDTSQLQTWFATEFYAGVDQYQFNPLPTDKAAIDAAYLRKLAAEAPLIAQADLNAWAAYTQQVADNAQPAKLAAGAPAAKDAANRVKAWLANTSGCKQLYKATPPASAILHKKFDPVGWIIAAAVAIVALGAIGARSNGKNGRSTARAKNAVGTPSRPPQKAEPYKPVSWPKTLCTKCSGTKEMDDTTCNGTGRKSTGHPNETMVCFLCNGRGKVTCNGCRGTGFQ